MSVTSTSATTRLALNTWQSRNVHISDSGAGRVDIDYKDSAGAAQGTVSVDVFAGTAQQIQYTAKGEITIATALISSAGIGAALLTAISTGTLAARFQAVDTLLQTRTVIPA